MRLTLDDVRDSLSNGATVVEVVESSLARAADVQARFNCFVELWADEARERARFLDSLPLDLRGPLHGVPVAIKDTTPWAGHRCTYGSRVFANNFATHTSWVVERLLTSGAVIVGSTNSPEFAHSSITDNRLHGPTLNPFDVSRTPGGSSGGAAVSVATGCVALAEGTDMGGSVRIPAAWTGCVGLKPSLGRIPMDGLPGLFDSISHHGPISNCVDDAWEFLLACQGPSMRDPFASHTALSGSIDVDVHSISVALSLDLGLWSVDRDIEQSVIAAAQRLTDAGARVVESDFTVTHRDQEVWVDMWSVFMASYYGDSFDVQAEQLDPDVSYLIRRGRKVSAPAYKALEVERTDFWNRVARVLEKHQVILCPTMSRSPLPATKAEQPLGGEYPDDGLAHSADMTSVWNLAAPCPAISVPGGQHTSIDDAGLPIGVQLIGRPADERTLLSAASVAATIAPTAR